VGRPFFSLIVMTSGANPTTSEFTTTYNASVVIGKSVSHIKRKYFCFQNTQGYSWRWEILQRWRFNSRSQVRLLVSENPLPFSAGT
jgi:hypothetical protein